jgi:hypothetical protein
MNKAMLSLLSESERLLVQETEPPALRGLDEDAAGELLLRARPPPNKSPTNHRRPAAARVPAALPRAAAKGSANKTAMKAEIFEDALARVSAQLGRLAKASAAELRAERLAAAKSARAASPRPSAARGTGRSTPRSAAPARGASARARRPVETKQVASTRAAGARRQARRDSR